MRLATFIIISIALSWLSSDSIRFLGVVLCLLAGQERRAVDRPTDAALRTGYAQNFCQFHVKEMGKTMFQFSICFNHHFQKRNNAMIYHLGVGTIFKLIDPLKTGPSIFSKRDIFLGVTCLQLWLIKLDVFWRTSRLKPRAMVKWPTTAVIWWSNWSNLHIRGWVVIPKFLHSLWFVQWEFQDPKMEVLYHIRPFFWGIFPYIGLKNRPYIW